MGPDTRWKRMHVTLGAPARRASHIVVILVPFGTGDVYFERNDVTIICGTAH